MKETMKKIIDYCTFPAKLDENGKASVKMLAEEKMDLSITKRVSQLFYLSVLVEAF